MLDSGKRKNQLDCLDSLITVRVGAVLHHHVSNACIAEPGSEGSIALIGKSYDVDFRGRSSILPDAFIFMHELCK